MNVLELSLVIPCHNEEKNLRPLLSAIHETLDPLGLDYEVMITDDCSTDNSWSVLKELAGKHQRCRLHLSRVQTRMHRAREIFQRRASFSADLDKNGGISRGRSPGLDKSALLGHQSLRCLESFVQIIPRPACSALDEIEANQIRNF